MFQFHYLGTTDYFLMGCFIIYHSKIVFSISASLYISEIYVSNSLLCKGHLPSLTPFLMPLSFQIPNSSHTNQILSVILR